MTSQLQSSLVRPHTAFARALSFLLLGFIVYGTTVEAAHKHGSPSVAKSPQGVVFVSDPGTETKSGGTFTSCADCLICQLQQQFSASLISVPPSLNLSAIKSRFSILESVSVGSQPSTATTGRAPPYIS